MKKIIFFFLLINCGVFAQTLDSTIFKTAPSFSGQVAVMRGDSLIFAGSCGWMNYPMQQKMNNNVMIEIGELSSQFTREAFQELIDKNTISVNDAVAKHIAGFPYANIDIKDLLNHTSGLPSNYIKLFHRNIFNDENIKVKDKLTITNKSIIDVLVKFKPALEFVPGEKIALCNTNDILLAYLLEVFYFKSYDEIINEMITKKYPKLNIIACSDWRNVPLINRASGQLKNDSLHYSIQETLHDMGFKYDDATLGHHHIYATAESLVKYFHLHRTYEKHLASFELKGHEPGFNSKLYRTWGETIVVLSNTTDDNDVNAITAALAHK
jgi:CubicO group peptidase (beta-lactamase class C family)